MRVEGEGGLVKLEKVGKCFGGSWERMEGGGLEKVERGWGEGIEGRELEEVCELWWRFNRRVGVSSSGWWLGGARMFMELSSLLGCSGV